jgi:hypothetical protein
MIGTKENIKIGDIVSALMTLRREKDALIVLLLAR